MVNDEFFNNALKLLNRDIVLFSVFEVSPNVSGPESKIIVLWFAKGVLISGHQPNIFIFEMIVVLWKNILRLF